MPLLISAVRISALSILLGLAGVPQQSGIQLSIASKPVPSCNSVYIIVTLKNASGNRVDLGMMPAGEPPADAFIHFSVVGRNGRPAALTAYGRASWQWSISFVPIALGPGEQLQRETVLTRVFDLSEGGTYLVQASFHQRNFDLVSNQLTVVVGPPRAP